MTEKSDLIGQTFGTLTVVEQLPGKVTTGGYKKGNYFRCECSCGGEVITRAVNLRNTTRNCKDCKRNNAKKEMIGKEFSTNKYGVYKVIDYIDSSRIEVEFLNTGFRRWSQLKEVKTGMVKDKLARVVHGVGYFGVGEYEGTVTVDGKKKNSPAYEVWMGMLKRCYSQNEQTRMKCGTYDNVTVCEEWLNFQNFAKWYYSNVPSYHKPALDKDLKIIGNTEYSPDACSFVPFEVNSLFTGTKGNRDLPRGVHFCNTKKVYIVQLQEGALTAKGGKKQTYYGHYDNIEDAIPVYIKEKKRHVKEVAEINKDKIDPIVYYNLVNNCEKFL